MNTVYQDKVQITDKNENQIYVNEYALEIWAAWIFNQLSEKTILETECKPEK